MDFTREPIIETVITPKDGFKLVVRSSKSTAQEEYFVDAVEVVSFGNSFFFRSIERPKSFLVPVCDYEVVEVREARMVLKNVGIDKSIKIGGGREKAPKLIKETAPVEKEQHVEQEAHQPAEEPAEVTAEAKTDGKVDKKKDRRRHYRRRRNREDGTAPKEGEEQDENGELSDRDSQESDSPQKERQAENGSSEFVVTSTSFISSLLPPPPTLISETIARYKDNALFKGAFYSKEELDLRDKDDTKETVATESFEKEPEELDLEKVSLEESAFGSFDEPNAVYSDSKQAEDFSEEPKAMTETESEGDEDTAINYASDDIDVEDSEEAAEGETTLKHSNQNPTPKESSKPIHDPDDHDHYVF